jgi:RNA polymerase sigma-70 factor (ECF subfamily)
MTSDAARDAVWDSLARRILACNATSRPIPEELEEEFAAHARTICMRMYVRRLPAEEADELAQQVVVKTWRSLPTFRGPQGGYSLLSLVRVAASNALKTFCRRAAERPDVVVSQIVREMEDDEGTEDLVEAGKGFGSPPPDPLGLLISDDLQRLLQQRLAQLPTLQQKAFWLHHVDGLRFGQVGKVLGTNENAAKMASSRAAQALLEVYHTYERGPEYSGERVGSGERGEGR